MKKHDVVGIGSCLVDYMVMVPKLAGPDEKINVDVGLQKEAGGATTCNLAQCARLGLHSAWLGKIGDDENGQAILQAFRAEGMDETCAIVVPGASSAFTWVPVDKQGERCIYIFPNITKTLTAAEVRQHFMPAIQNAGILHTEIGVIHMDAVLEGMRIAKEAGVRTLVDLDVDVNIFLHENNRGKEGQMEELLQLCDVLKGSCHHAMDYTGAGSPEAAARELLGRGPKLVALTGGADGSWFATKEEMLRQPAYQVKAVDSTGAGDAFAGGLSYGVLNGWPLDRVARFASACGAYCCLRAGARMSGTYREVVDYFRLAE